MDPTFPFKDDPEIKQLMIMKQKQVMQAQQQQQQQAMMDHQNQLQLASAKKQLPPGDASVQPVQAENVTDKGVGNALKFLMQQNGGAGAQVANAGQ